MVYILPYSVVYIYIYMKKKKHFINYIYSSLAINEKIASLTFKINKRVYYYVSSSIVHLPATLTHNPNVVQYIQTFIDFFN